MPVLDWAGERHRVGQRLEIGVLTRLRESATSIRNHQVAKQRESAGTFTSLLASSEENMTKNLSNLQAPRKANTGRKRVGRGMGSGMGKTSTRGHKGQGSRTGSSMMRGFEGGQMPLHRRMPKRGFTNIFRIEYTVVNLDRIVEQTEGKAITEIGLDDYIKLGLASSKKALIKILGSGELNSAITIHAHKFSKSAVEKIEKAGGKALVLGGATE